MLSITNVMNLLELIRNQYKVYLTTKLTVFLYLLLLKIMCYFVYAFVYGTFAKLMYAIVMRYNILQF